MKANGYILLDEETAREANIGDELITHRGKSVALSSGTPPNKAMSVGSVVVKDLISGQAFELDPSEVGLTWYTDDDNRHEDEPPFGVVWCAD